MKMQDTSLSAHGRRHYTSGNTKSSSWEADRKLGNLNATSNAKYI